jgi:hypothetical protein
MKREIKHNSDKKTRLPDVRTLLQRETKIDTRKGMPLVKKQGYVDLTEYKEQKLFSDEKI